ncbi:MAG: matrixin family metalloprotease [Pirellulaceae bacterium]
MVRFFSIALSFAIFTTASIAIAQPPSGTNSIDSRRWTGSTALGQAQGFAQGSPLTLTWGFMANGTVINDNAHSGFPNGVNNLQTRLNTIYGSQAVWQPHFQSVFNRWSAVSGLSYVFEANDDGAAIGTNTFPGGQVGVRADVRIGGKALDGNSNVLAYNYFPNVGDMVIDTNDNFYNDISSSSIRLRNVVAHEHGHGIGMAHAESTTVPAGQFLMEPFFSNAFDGPQYWDILVAHRGYGDVHEKSFSGLGNDIATRATALGNVVTGGSVSIGNDARNLPVAPTEIDFVSIDDNTDTDFFSFQVSAPGNVSILLESLGQQFTIGPQDGVNGNEPLFDTQLRSDLVLSLFASNGSTLLASVNATSFGGNETISNFILGNAGTYFVRVTGVDNTDSIYLDTQFYGLNVSFVGVPEPGSLALLLGAGMALSFTRRRRK